MTVESLISSDVTPALGQSGFLASAVVPVPESRQASALGATDIYATDSFDSDYDELEDHIFIPRDDEPGMWDPLLVGRGSSAGSQQDILVTLPSKFGPGRYELPTGMDRPSEQGRWPKRERLQSRSADDLVIGHRRRPSGVASASSVSFDKWSSLENELGFLRMASAKNLDLPDLRQFWK